jgi:hypothetical protein
MPAGFVAVTRWSAADSGVVGVPVTTPVAVSNDRPTGSAGSIEKVVSGGICVFGKLAAIGSPSS